MILNIINFIMFFFGGLDWIIDSWSCFFAKSDYLFKDDVFIWEPNFNSYNEWVDSMLLQDPSYEIDLDLTRQHYVDAKYPNLNMIEDDDVMNYIQAELFGYEDEYN